MTDLDRMAITAALRNMFSHGWVSIVDIDQCLKLAKVVPPAHSYEILRTLHCVHFKDMDQELASQVPNLITQCFNSLDMGDVMKTYEGLFTKLVSQKRLHA